MIKTILVVDDEPDILMMIKDALTLEGYEVTTAKDGSSALEQFKENKPDLAVLDTMMPEMSGHELCQAIRELDKNVKIIIVTSKIDAVDAGKAMKSGANDFAVKTSNCKMILDSIKKLTG